MSTARFHATSSGPLSCSFCKHLSGEVATFDHKWEKFTERFVITFFFLRQSNFDLFLTVVKHIRVNSYSIKGLLITVQSQNESARTITLPCKDVSVLAHICFAARVPGSVQIGFIISVQEKEKTVNQDIEIWFSVLFCS